MTEAYGDRTPSRAAWLELQEESRLVQEGYDFLDEKRLLLAAEMLRVREQYNRLMHTFRMQHEKASASYVNVLAMHGLQNTQVYPCTLLPINVARKQHSFLGVSLQDTWLEQDKKPISISNINHTSEKTELCSQAFRQLIEIATKLAGLSGNLRRLMYEYRRTERRARALENVLLPEIDAALKEMTGRLEEIDLEDAIRVRQFVRE